LGRLGICGKCLGLRIYDEVWPSWWRALKTPAGMLPEWSHHDWYQHAALPEVQRSTASACLPRVPLAALPPGTDPSKLHHRIKDPCPYFRMTSVTCALNRVALSLPINRATLDLQTYDSPRSRIQHSAAVMASVQRAPGEARTRRFSVTSSLCLLAKL